MREWYLHTPHELSIGGNQARLVPLEVIQELLASASKIQSVSYTYTQTHGPEP